MARQLAAIAFVMTLVSVVPRAEAQFSVTQFAPAPRARAQFSSFNAFCDRVVTDFKRNNCWPEPFVCPDRATVRAPFNVMVHNGWQLQNTISYHHFDEGTGELTVAGRNKIYWILNHAPKQHRVVYVQKAREPETTLQRMEMVRGIAQTCVPVGTLAQVEATINEPPGWTAERVGFVSQAFETSAPPPRLPAASSGSSSSGGGS